jgi:hypothetical protein
MSQGFALTTPLSQVGHVVHVIMQNVTASQTHLVTQDYELKCIGTHLLWASGAMTLKLQGVDASLIIKIGRWTGLTFLTYMHAQISDLITSLAQQMVTCIHLVNVAG